MRVNTYDATPLHEEIISVPAKPSDTPRIFDDGSSFANIWVELEPGLFWCGLNPTDASRTRSAEPDKGLTLLELEGFYPDSLRDVTRFYH
jgi:hypothetical protein